VANKESWHPRVVTLHDLDVGHGVLNHMLDVLHNYPVATTLAMTNW
jgi:hypothetical protein